MLKLIKILLCLVVLVGSSGLENETVTEPPQSPVTLSVSAEKMIENLPSEHQDQFRDRLHEAHRIKPQMDLRSIFFCIKVITSEFYNKFGVKRMIKNPIPWPERMKKIIEQNDQFAPGLYYENVHVQIPWYDTTGMNQSYYNWFAYASWNLTGQKLLSCDQLKARDLQTSLDKYFSKLEAEKRKSLYGSEPGLDEMTGFKRYFAAVVSRSYKFALNFANTVEGYLADLHLSPATRRVGLVDGIKRIMPNWYFDQEMLDMLNILKDSRNATKCRTSNKTFSSVLTFVNGLNETVLLPGLS